MESHLGRLKVTEYQGQIQVTVKGGTFTYDGEPHKASVKVDELPDGYTVESADSLAEVTNVEDGPVTAKADTLVIRNAQGEDVTDRLNIVITEETLAVAPMTLQINTPSAAKVYDGTDLTAEGTIEGLVEGETASFETTGSANAVGSVENTYTLTWDGSAKESNYKVEASVGTLTITESEDQIVVTTTGGTYTYDGKEHIAKVTVDNLPAGYSVQTAKSSTAVIDAEENVPVTADELVIVNAAGEDVTDKLNILKVDGTITVEKAVVTVTTPAAEATYNGEALTAEGRLTGLVKGETAGFTTTGSQTAVGSSDNTYELTWNGSAKESNYTVSENIGTLTVNEYAGTVKVTVEGGTFTYDGQEHGATVTVTGLPEAGYTVVSASSSAKATDATQQPVAATADDLKIVNAAGEDVTSLLHIDLVNGEIIINKRDVVLTSATKETTYGGTELTDATVSIGGDGFAEGEGMTATVTGTQTVVGTSANTFEYQLNEGTKESNYNITTVNGQLTVKDRDTKYAITITANSSDDSESYIYDGTEKTVSGVNTSKVIIDGVTYTITGLEASASATDAGSYPVNVSGTAKVTDAKGNDVTDQFAVSVQTGVLNIRPREVIMTSASDSKVYDGEVLTNKTVRVTGDGFAEGEGAEVSVSGRQKAVGSSENLFTYSLKEGTLEKNYTIQTISGKLTVVSRDEKPQIRIEGRNGSFVYDGSEHTVEGFSNMTVTVNGKEYTISGITSTVTGTDAGTYEAVINGSAVVTDEDGNDVTDQFDLSIVPARMTIEKRPITLTSQSATKTFDGSSLSAGAVNVTSGSFVGDDAEKIKVNVYGTVTTAGQEALNGFTISWGDVDEKNYDVTYVFGTLSVTAAAETEETAGTEPEGTEQTDNQSAGTQNLAIHYVDTEGTTMANDWSADYEVGTSFAIVSPVINGYTPDFTTVISPRGGMPARDLELTVTYTPTVSANGQQNAQSADGTTVNGALINENGRVLGEVETEAREATGADLKSVEDVQTPLGQIILGNEGTDEEDVEIELISVEDIETPLANIEIHLCNAAPFLMLILTLAILIAYAEDMKKQKKRLFELRKQIKED